MRCSLCISHVLSLVGQSDDLKQPLLNLYFYHTNTLPSNNI